MLAPERRTRTDIAVAVAIVVAIALFIGVMWWRSDSRATTSAPAATPIPVPAMATVVPAKVSEIWSAPSPQTQAALVVQGTVVTGDGGAVVGHDPITGRELWRYSRDIPLCDVIGAWNSTLAVYRDSRGCGQAIVLKGEDGSRNVTRNSAADQPVALSTDGTYVVSRGDSRMELWRSDLVRTLEYGRVEDPNQPNTQPRQGRCELVSAVSSSSHLALVENCPDDPGYRLSILHPAPKDAQKPEEFASMVIDGVSAETGTVQLVAAGSDRFAAYLADEGQKPRIAYFDVNANPDGQMPLPAEFDGELTIGNVGPVTTVWGGSQVVALDTIDLDVLWTKEDALGPGAIMAGDLLLPVPGGIAVVDPLSGALERTIAITRRSSATPVTTEVSGGVIIEQRGDEVVALR